MEHELFGHERGAFTGAHTRRRGRFETANRSDFLTRLRARLERPWTFAILFVSLSFLVVAYVFSPERPVDGIGHLISLYAAVADEVPVDAAVAFLAATPESPDAITIYFLAQHGLAPRILTRDISASRLVVSSPGATIALDRDPRLSGFSLHSVHNAGIRIYVRGVR